MDFVMNFVENQRRRFRDDTSSYHFRHSSEAQASGMFYFSLKIHFRPRNLQNFQSPMELPPNSTSQISNSVDRWSSMVFLKCGDRTMIMAKIRVDWSVEHEWRALAYVEVKVTSGREVLTKDRAIEVTNPNILQLKNEVEIPLFEWTTTNRHRYSVTEGRLEFSIKIQVLEHYGGIHDPMKIMLDINDELKTENDTYKVQLEEHKKDLFESRSQMDQKYREIQHLKTLYEEALKEKHRLEVELNQARKTKEDDEPKSVASNMSEAESLQDSYEQLELDDDI